MIPNAERAQLLVSLRETHLRSAAPFVRLPLFSWERTSEG